MDVHALCSEPRRLANFRKLSGLSIPKQVCQEEWQAITMNQVRARIAEMPKRCRMLVETGGKVIKSSLW